MAVDGVQPAADARSLLYSGSTLVHFPGCLLSQGGTLNRMTKHSLPEPLARQAGDAAPLLNEGEDEGPIN